MSHAQQTPSLILTRLFVLCWFVLIGLMAGCSSAPLTTANEAMVPIKAANADNTQTASDDYRLAVGDAIEVKLFFNPEMNESQAIRPDGKITMQLIGELMVAGMTTAEVEELLRSRYVGLLKKPQPTVFVRKFAPQRVYIGGQVPTPAAIPFEGPLTLMQAIITTGGFRFNAEKRNILVFRNNGLSNAETLVVNLEQQLEPVGTQSAAANCATSICPTDAPLKVADNAPGYIRRGDIRLQANDIIYVPQTTIGQVAQYMDENFAKIFPLYHNMGVNLYYQLNKRLQSTMVIQPPGG